MKRRRRRMRHPATPVPAPVARGALPFLGLLVALAAAACGPDDDFWDDPRWDVAVDVAEDHLLVTATIGDAHGDFVHVSIRRDGHDNGYTIERSPAPNQPERDWSRVHHWFGEMHRDTWLEGRFDDGSGRGPRAFTTFAYEVPRAAGGTRENYEDTLGGDHVYITRGYSYADGNGRHPGFGPGTYEIEIYAWYTGRANQAHPAAGGETGVQYVHYERPLATAVFVVEQ